MTDPSRLLDGDATETERVLLEAGRCEQPGSDGVRKAATALGVAAVISTGASVATAGKAGTIALLQWVAIALAGGSGVVLGALWLGRSPTSAPEPSADPPAAVVPVPPAKAAVPPAPIAPSASAAPMRYPPPVRPPAPVVVSLKDETALLDVARRALASGNPPGALAALDRYAREHPRGMLSEEATLLRIESLDQSGNRAAATQLARQFLASHPGSPHAKRLGTLLGGSR
jgi:hypothetical protein